MRVPRAPCPRGRRRLICQSHHKCPALDRVPHHIIKCTWSSTINMRACNDQRADVNAAMLAAFFRVQHFRCSSVRALTHMWCETMIGPPSWSLHRQLLRYAYHSFKLARQTWPKNWTTVSSARSGACANPSFQKLVCIFRARVCSECDRPATTAWLEKINTVPCFCESARDKLARSVAFRRWCWPVQDYRVPDWLWLWATWGRWSLNDCICIATRIYTVNRSSAVTRGLDGPAVLHSVSPKFWRLKRSQR
jgi:hypothetical protein